jgi:hypothetical protein
LDLQLQSGLQHDHKLLLGLLERFCSLRSCITPRGFWLKGKDVIYEVWLPLWGLFGWHCYKDFQRFSNAIKTGIVEVGTEKNKFPQISK